MSRFLKKIKTKFSLLVSLVKNDPFLAEEAIKGGADSIKVHLNVKHRASKTLFKTWKEEKKNIKRIIDISDIPVGIVPGAEKVADPDEMIDMRKLGIDFWDIFSHHLPLYLFEVEKMGKMSAIDYRFNLDHLPFLEKQGIQIFETSIIEPAEYGQALTSADIARYGYLLSKINIPAIVPTQRKIQPEEVRYLKNIGFSGIGIGAVVTGKNRSDLRKIVSLYRDSIDRIS
jgi:hypothetical protein